MTLALNKERLALLYGFLVECKPFCHWKNMPASAEITFKITRSKTTSGHYLRRNGKHEIGISSVCCGWINELVRVMIHEMLHIHQATSGMETPHAEHNAAFHKSAKGLCKCFGLDPHMF
jgi:hypothetical protein